MSVGGEFDVYPDESETPEAGGESEQERIDRAVAERVRQMQSAAPTYDETNEQTSDRPQSRQPVNIEAAIAKAIETSRRAFQEENEKAKKEAEWAALRQKVDRLPDVQDVANAIAAANGSTEAIKTIRKDMEALKTAVAEAKSAAEAAQKEANKPLKDKINDFRDVFDTVRDVYGGGDEEGGASRHGMQILDKFFDRMQTQAPETVADARAKQNSNSNGQRPQPQAQPQQTSNATSGVDWQTAYGGEYRILGPVLDELMVDIGFGVPALHATDSAMYKLYRFPAEAEQFASVEPQTVAGLLRELYPSHPLIQRWGGDLSNEIARMQAHYRQRRAKLLELQGASQPASNQSVPGPHAGGHAGGNGTADPGGAGAAGVQGASGGNGGQAAVR